MENKIKIFENKEFGSLRTLEENGKILFCGKDVAAALGYSNTKDAIKRHCRWGVKHDIPHPQSPTKTIEMTFIPEGDVYRLVAHSKLPGAVEFESWIFDKILPQINRTGGYVANEDMFIENYLPFLDEPYQNLFRLQMMAINQLNERIRHDQPLVEFANQVSNTDNLIDMNAMAKLAVEENIPIGRNRLFKWLRKKGILIRNGMKRVRKKESSFILASQNIEDFLLPEIKEFTKPLFSIPSHHFLFNPGNISPVDFMDTLQVEQSEYGLIKYPERGTCLYRCGNERYLLQVHAPDYKVKLFGSAGGR